MPAKEATQAARTSEVPSKSHADKTGAAGHGNSSDAKSSEHQAVPLGGKRIPKGMEDHADWESLPVQEPAAESGERASSSSASTSAALEAACDKSTCFKAMMEMRTSMESSKKYLANIARNAAVLSRAHGLGTTPSEEDSELPNTKPAQTRPRSLSLQSAKTDMTECKQKLEELKAHKPLSFSGDNEVSGDLKKNCTEYINTAQEALVECVNVGLQYANTEASNIQVAELSAEITAATRKLFQNKNKLLNLIKEIKQEIATKNNIPIHVPATHA